jgi:hypothetical protein
MFLVFAGLILVVLAVVGSLDLGDDDREPPSCRRLVLGAATLMMTAAGCSAAPRVVAGDAPVPSATAPVVERDESRSEGDRSVPLPDSGAVLGSVVERDVTLVDMSAVYAVGQRVETLDGPMWVEHVESGWVLFAPYPPFGGCTERGRSSPVAFNRALAGSVWARERPDQLQSVCRIAAWETWWGEQLGSRVCSYAGESFPCSASRDAGVLQLNGCCWWQLAVDVTGLPMSVVVSDLTVGLDAAFHVWLAHGNGWCGWMTAAAARVPCGH